MIKLIKRFVPNSIKQSAKLYLKRGSKYKCPFCNYSSSELRIIGADSSVLQEKQVVGGGKREAGCLKCGSTDRERLVWLFLKSKFEEIREGVKVKLLHIAPERNLSNVLSHHKKIDYVAGDKFAKGYKYRDEVVDLDLLDLPFEDNLFDILICNHVLEHILDDAKAMNEIYRVLKKDAYAILQVPISKTSDTTFEDSSIVEPKEREKAFGQHDHVRIYGLDYTDRLENCGFKVQKKSLFQSWPQFGLNAEEELFVATKT